MTGYIATLLIAIVWGYFADLKNGQVGWFIGRLIFMPFFYFILSQIMGW